MVIKIPLNRPLPEEILAATALDDCHFVPIEEVKPKGRAALTKLFPKDIMTVTLWDAVGATLLLKMPLRASKERAKLNALVIDLQFSDAWVT